MAEAAARPLPDILRELREVAQRKLDRGREIQAARREIDTVETKAKKLKSNGG